MNDQEIIATPNQPEIQEQQLNDTWESADQLPTEIAQAQAYQEQIENEKKIVQEKSVEQPKVKTPDESFRELKAKALRAERERDELLRKLQESQQQSKVESLDEDLSVNIAPDEIAEGKHLSKVQKKISRLEQQLKESERRNQEIALEMRLRNQYADFDTVVNADNISLLKDLDPESAMIVDAIPNLYTKAVAAYKAIKNITVRQQKEDLYAADKEKAQRNSSKPRPAVAISPQAAENPLSQVNAFSNGLTPELEKQLRKEMEDARNSF